MNNSEVDEEPLKEVLYNFKKFVILIKILIEIYFLVYKYNILFYRI